MANYIAMARSNYFKVKDVEAFKKRFHGMQDMEVIEDDEGRVGLMCNGEGAWPSDVFDEDSNEHVDYDFVKDLQSHLAPKQVVVLIEIGFEKMRYLVGQARAFTNRGPEIFIQLSDIYKLAAEKFKIIPTVAEY